MGALPEAAPRQQGMSSLGLGNWSKVPEIRVPEVTALFWIIKVLTTGMGEAASDFLAHTLGPVPAVGLSGLGLVGALFLQFRARRYIAGAYWTAVVMVSVFGTLAADAAHVGFGVPYWTSTICFFVTLGVIFLLWQRREGTLSVHSIFTRRREMFYWATVLCTFALGTAAGDLTAVSLGLGWLASGLLFAGLIAVPAVLARVGLNSVLAFWWAYVLTRPLGASFADWMALPHSRGGLGAGTGVVTLAMSGVIVLLVGSLALTQRKTASSAAETERRGRTA
ncbi:COG4705 family protein [Deinococcus sp. UYEF24]